MKLYNQVKSRRTPKYVPAGSFIKNKKLLYWNFASPEDLWDTVLCTMGVSVHTKLKTLFNYSSGKLNTLWNIRNYSYVPPLPRGYFHQNIFEPYSNCEFWNTGNIFGLFRSFYAALLLGGNIWNISIIDIIWTKLAKLVEG